MGPGPQARYLQAREQDNAYQQSDYQGQGAGKNMDR